MKKGQVQSGETIAVVIIVIIMIVIGIVFFANSKREDLKSEQTKLQEIDSMKIAVLAAGLDEIKCSNYGVQAYKCVDLYRLDALSEVIENNEEGAYRFYYDTFKNTKIEFKIIIDDSENGMLNKTLYNFNDTANKSVSTIFVPVLVSDPYNKKNYFSIIEVVTYY